MSWLCKAGLFFLRCITADPSPSGNFTPPTKRYCEETLGDLEPIHDLFTVMGEIILSCLIYTGINSMHSQKTKQPYIRSARKKRTRKKKSAVEEDPRKITQKIYFYFLIAHRIADINTITKERKASAQALEKEISKSKYNPVNS